MSINIASGTIQNIPTENSVLNNTPANENESVEQLFDRIEPLYNDVDILDLDPSIVEAIAISELSGKPTPDSTKRLMVLNKKKIIDDKQYFELAIMVAKRGYR